MKTWITPSLAVADFEETVNHAFHQIKGGLTGVVSNLDEAREVMSKLGMTEAEQDERIHFALTGEILSGGR